MRGVVVGITTVAFAPARVAAKATPWAWLPALAVMMPRESSSGESVEIL